MESDLTDGLTLSEHAVEVVTAHDEGVLPFADQLPRFYFWVLTERSKGIHICSGPRSQD
jgi:hypothetical protein